MIRTLSLSLGFFALTALVALANEAPTLSAIPNATVPGGKSVVIPLQANDPDGDPLTYTVTSSNGSIIARVKTGLPFLKMNVTHTSSGEGDTSYAGTMALALFRDWTPHTADSISGLVQSGFYDGLLFHRLVKGEGVDVIQGGGSMNNANYGATVKIRDEYQPQLIYSGSGQLAMANSGLDTNGSQFFITTGPQRGPSIAPTNSLFDFNYTIFGQLTRGLDLVNNIRGTKTNGTTPESFVTITSATLEPQSAPGNTDAVLLLSAPGTDSPATITVTVSDQSNLSASTTFTATPATDAVDDPPFLASSTKDQTVPKNTIISIPFALIDLEFDPMLYVWGNASPANLPPGFQNGSTKQKALFLAPPEFRGALSLKIGRYQEGATGRGSRGGSVLDLVDADVVNVSVGDGTYMVNPLSVETTKGSALTNVTVGRLIVSPTADAKSLFAATINWGDNTVENGILVKTAAGYDIRGTHTYARSGFFPISVSVRDQFTVKQNNTTFTVSGARREANLIAYVVDALNAPFAVRGQSLTLQKVGRLNGIVATFTDAAAGGSAQDYAATIDWGDGHFTQGVIKAARSGLFTVSGSNIYSSADDYSLCIRIARAGNDPAAFGYSRLHIGGSRPSLPPFRNVDVQGKWLQLNFSNTGTGSDLAGIITGQFKVQNNGKLPSTPGTITAFYSTDEYAGNGDDANLGDVAIPALQPGKSTILIISAKAGSSHAPFFLPKDVDFSKLQNSNIVTRLRVPHAIPVIIDVNHFYVDHPVEKK